MEAGRFIFIDRQIRLPPAAADEAAERSAGRSVAIFRGTRSRDGAWGLRRGFHLALRAGAIVPVVFAARRGDRRGSLILRRVRSRSKSATHPSRDVARPRFTAGRVRNEIARMSTEKWSESPLTVMDQTRSGLTSAARGAVSRSRVHGVDHAHKRQPPRGRGHAAGGASFL